MKTSCLRARNRLIWKWRRRALLLLGLLMLSAGLSTALLPLALAREPTPADLIADGLPRKKTLKIASKSEFLSAVCAAVRRYRTSAVAITSTAVATRRESAGDIVGMVLRCSGRLDCEFVGEVVTKATAAEGNAASTIGDSAIAKAPNCVEAIREAIKGGAEAGERAKTEVGTEQSPLAGTSNSRDEGFDPREELKLVCDGGTPRAVRASQVEEFLRSHPGSFVGACPPPSPSPMPSAAAANR